MKLYTKTGDDGTTALLGGGRLAKAHVRVCAYGEVDELNAALGWSAVLSEGAIARRLRQVQEALFVLSAELAGPPQNKPAEGVVQVSEAQVGELEMWIDEAMASLPPLRNFILPGGSELAARLHLTRVMCRRSERAVVRLSQAEAVRPILIQYLNRLGDALFAWARLANHEDGRGDVTWTMGERA